MPFIGSGVFFLQRKDLKRDRRLGTLTYRDPNSNNNNNNNHNNNNNNNNNNVDPNVDPPDVAMAASSPLPLGLRQPVLAMAPMVTQSLGTKKPWKWIELGHACAV